MVLLLLPPPQHIKLLIYNFFSTGHFSRVEAHETWKTKQNKYKKEKQNEKIDDPYDTKWPPIDPIFWKGLKVMDMHMVHGYVWNIGLFSSQLSWYQASTKLKRKIG